MMNMKFLLDVAIIFFLFIISDIGLLCLIGGLIGLGIFGWGFFADSTVMVVIGALLYAFAGLILYIHRQEEKRGY